MKLAFPVRLGLFAVAMISSAAIVGWRGWEVWRETGRLGQAFEAVQVDRLQVADRYRAAVLDLNHALLRYGFFGEAADRDRYLSQATRFEAWLGERTPFTGSSGGQQLLGEIRTAFSNYQADARPLLESREAGTPVPARYLDKVETDAVRMQEFGRRLAEMQREDLAAYLRRTQHAVSVLHEFTVGALGLLLILGSILGWQVWRELVAPLRARLVESRRLIERQEKLSSLGVLAAGVAHEIRNPLTSIKARVFTLQRSFPPASAEAEDARVISCEITRLDRIVSSFLQFARPPEPQLATVAITRLVAETRELLSPEMTRLGVTLTTTGDDPSLEVRADPDQIKQVLINLIRNAAEATGAGGRVAIRTTARLARLSRGTEPVAAVDVADNGPGIPPDGQRRLFDPFFTTKPAGTGLGLSIAVRILEKHGGALQYQTAPGSGTTFSLLLPRLSATPGQR